MTPACWSGDDRSRRRLGHAARDARRRAADRPGRQDLRPSTRRCASSPTPAASAHRPGRRHGRRVAPAARTTTTDVFIESAWFDPIRTAQTGRATGINSDAQYRFARGVDPRLRGARPGAGDQADPGALRRRAVGGRGGRRGARPRPSPIAFDPAYVKRLSGLTIAGRRGSTDILDRRWASTVDGDDCVTPPTWRRDVEGKADLVEEVARIDGYDALPVHAPARDRPRRPAAC